MNEENIQKNNSEINNKYCKKRKYNELMSVNLTQLSTINKEFKKLKKNEFFTKNNTSLDKEKLFKNENDKFVSPKESKKFCFGEKQFNNITISNKNNNSNFINKKKIKSSEDIILEEMAKYKFSAQPLKREIFNKCRSASNNNILLNKKNKEENEKIVNFSQMLKNINILKINKLESENSKKNRLVGFHHFKAKSVPKFTYFEIKKSNKSLTIPVSPKLKTKSRLDKKLK